MGLLGDFLLGAITQGGPRVMADMDQREREQRMRQDRAAEIERQRRIQLEDYDRARRDRQADFEAQQKAIVEREQRQEAARAQGLLAQAQRQAELKRQEQERIAGLQTQSSTGVTDTQMAGIRQGINPFGGETEDGVMPDEIAANKERFLKVTQEYNRNLLNVAQGVKPDDAIDMDRKRRVDEAIAKGNYDEAERLARIYGGGRRTQAEIDAQVDSTKARADKARADAASGAKRADAAVTRANQPPGAGRAAGTPGQVTDARALASLDREAGNLRSALSRAQAAASKAQNELANAVGEKRRQAMQPAVDAAQAEVNRIAAQLQAVERQRAGLRQTSPGMGAGASGGGVTLLGIDR